MTLLSERLPPLEPSRADATGPLHRYPANDDATGYPPLLTAEAAHPEGTDR